MLGGMAGAQPLSLLQSPAGPSSPHAHQGSCPRLPTHTRNGGCARLLGRGRRGRGRDRGRGRLQAGFHRHSLCLFNFHPHPRYTTQDEATCSRSRKRLCRDANLGVVTPRCVFFLPHHLSSLLFSPQEVWGPGVKDDWDPGLPARSSEVS